jgi:hypothetical protein
MVPVEDNVTPFDTNQPTFVVDLFGECQDHNLSYLQNALFLFLVPSKWEKQ